MADIASLLALGLDHGRHSREIGLSEPSLEWLMSLARRLQARTTLETGFGLGFSAAALLHAGVGEHIAIDPTTAFRATALENVARARTPRQRFRLLEGLADRELPRLVAVDQRVDLMLIDAGHRFDDAFVEAHYARSLVQPGGVLLLDDINLNGVRAVVSWIETNMAHIWTPLAPPERIRSAPSFLMASFRRTGARDEQGRPGGNRPWDRHRRFETFDDQN